MDIQLNSDDLQTPTPFDAGPTAASASRSVPDTTEAGAIFASGRFAHEECMADFSR